jgi:hypothetical protein
MPGRKYGQRFVESLNAGKHTNSHKRGRNSSTIQRKTNPSSPQSKQPSTSHSEAPVSLSPSRVTLFDLIKKVAPQVGSARKNEGKSSWKEVLNAKSNNETKRRTSADEAVDKTYMERLLSYGDNGSRLSKKTAEIDGKPTHFLLKNRASHNEKPDHAGGHKQPAAKHSPQSE